MLQSGHGLHENLVLRRAGTPVCLNCLCSLSCAATKRDLVGEFQCRGQGMGGQGEGRAGRGGAGRGGAGRGGAGRGRAGQGRAGQDTLVTRTVPAMPRRPATPWPGRAQSSATSTVSTLCPSAFAHSAASPNCSLSPAPLSFHTAGLDLQTPFL